MDTTPDSNVIIDTGPAVRATEAKTPSSVCPDLVKFAGGCNPLRSWPWKRLKAATLSRSGTFPEVDLAHDQNNSAAPNAPVVASN
jgi:hypothetical protein